MSTARPVTKAERLAEVRAYVDAAIHDSEPVAEVARRYASAEALLARTFPSDAEQAHRADIAAAALAALTPKES